MKPIIGREYLNAKAVHMGMYAITVHLMRCSLQSPEKYRLPCANESGKWFTEGLCIFRNVNKAVDGFTDTEQGKYINRY